MNQIAPWLQAALSVIGGGLLVGLLNFFSERNKRKFEERQKLRELIFKSAIEVWWKTAELKNENVNRMNELGGEEKVEDPEIYILKMAQLLDKIEKEK